jgi:GAF domain-containing protein
VEISLFGIASQYENWRSVRTITTANAMSNLLIEQVLNHQLAVYLFVGLERFSEFVAQKEKYTRLGATCKQVLAFGVPDMDPPLIKGVNFIPIEPGSVLERERFVVVNSPDFWAGMVASEVETSNGLPSEQNFDGGWFYNRQMVERLSLLVSQVAGREYQPVQTRNYMEQNAHIAELNQRLLEQLEAAEIASHRRSMQLSTLHEFSAILLQHQPVPCILRDAVRILSTIFGASNAALALNLQGDQFMIFSLDGKLSTGNQRMSSLGQGASGQALNQSKLISVTDAVQTGQKDLLMPEAVSLVSAPIQGRRRVYGVVTVGSKTPDAWNEEDGKTVMAIATGLAVIIEQKAQVSGDIVLQLRRARLLEQMLTKLRKPMARLLYLQQRLQDQTHLLPMQQELMAEVEGLYTEVAKTIWEPNDPPDFNDSPISPPPKPTGSLSSKTRTS